MGYFLCFLVFCFSIGFGHFWAKVAKTSWKQKNDPWRGSEEKLDKWHGVKLFSMGFGTFVGQGCKNLEKKVSTLGEGLKKNWTGDLKWFPKFTWWIITSHTWLLVFGFWFYHGFGAFWAKRGHKLRWFGPVGFNLCAVSAQLVSKVMQLRHVWMQIGFNVRSLVLRAGPGHTVGNTAYH